MLTHSPCATERRGQIIARLSPIRQVTPLPKGESEYRIREAEACPREGGRVAEMSDCVDVWYVTGWGRRDKDPLKQTPRLTL